MMASKIFLALKRKKVNDVDSGNSELARVLTLTDLTALGVGATLGVGVYVLAGAVAKTVAGPAVCLSFLVAAVASTVAGLCYAEFAARVPKAGSAYIYSYVSVGEFVAFVIGWNLILEYGIGLISLIRGPLLYSQKVVPATVGSGLIFGPVSILWISANVLFVVGVPATASVARGLSNYIDALADKKIRDTFLEWMPMNIQFMSPYPDLLSFVFVMLLSAVLAIGVKESSTLNSIFTTLNLATIGVVIVAGSIKADVANWKIVPATIKDEALRAKAGTGGFMPFGIAGVMEGAAKCFYAFVGFDIVATTGEESKNPKRDIPLAIVISLVIIFASYFSISTVLTMIWPYYLQDADAPFPHVFEEVGWPVIKWIVTIGAIFALFTSMLGAMFPLPRVLYAMANDGIIFKRLASISPKTKTPLFATVLSGILAGIMAALFNLEQLIDMMSIGTLLAYTIVAVSVLLLRYQEDENSMYTGVEIKEKEETVEQSMLHKLKILFNLNNNKYPTEETSRVVNWSIVLFCLFTAFFCATIINGGKDVLTEPFFLIALIISTVAMFILLIIIARQPSSDAELSFKVPMVPYVPCLCVLFNLYLMLELDLHTWIRFLVWMVIGLLIYFFYGISHSVENPERRKTTLTVPVQDEITKF